jgi:hypothetical protein
LSVVIDQAVPARLIASAPRERAVLATLHYERSDPFAVRIAFPATASLDGEEVTWTFARELLLAGLQAPAGDGDVQVWPCGPHRTVLEFRAPEGMAVVQIDTRAARRFLLRSYTLVPKGSETRHLDLDGDLAALLREA